MLGISSREINKREVHKTKQNAYGFVDLANPSSQVIASLSEVQPRSVLPYEAPYEVASIPGVSFP